MASLRRLILAVALSGISSVACLGTAAIENWCDVEVYIWSIANVPNDTINYLEPNIGTFNETYRVNPNGGGISLKIATVPDDSFITQFEYTYHPDNPILAYDISNINGYPFESWGLYLSPSSDDCSNITCDPGVALCPDVYNQPHDDFAVKSCDVSANLTLTLCPPQTTSLETATVTVTTTDSAGDAILTTLATTITSVGPVTTSQGTLPETATVDSECSSTTATTTNLEPVVVTLLTTDTAGNPTLTTLTTTITSVGPVTTSQGTLPETVTVDSECSSTTATTTNLEPVVVTLMTTDTAGDATLTTLTTTITSVGPVVTSQDIASDIVTTDPATTNTIIISSRTILRASETTDAAGQLSLTTLTTVIAVTTTLD